MAPPTSAGAAVTIARKNLRRGLRSRSFILMGVVGPLVLGTVLALAFGGKGPTITVGLVDLDGSTVSKSMTSGLSEALAGSQVELKVRHAGTDPERLVDSGDVEAALVIPEGYGASVSSQPEALAVVRSAENGTASSVAEGFADEFAASTDLQRAVAAGLVRSGIDPMPTLQAGQVQPVITARVEPYGDKFDAPMYFGPLAVFLFLGLGGSARLLLRDEHDGILDRVRAAPVSPRSIVGGSSGAVLVQGLVAATVVIVGSSVVFGASWGQPVEVAVVILCFVISLAGLLGVIVGVAATEMQAESWTNVLAFLFAVVGGSFFGGVLLPGVFGLIGLLTPNGAAMRALIELGPGGRSLAEVWYLPVWMLVLGVAGMLVGGRMLERRLR
jgi:ABC-2 type transport system permease protein